MKLRLEWDLTDLEYAVLQRLVAAEGKVETVEQYAARVGLKGLRGNLEVRVQHLREQSIAALTKAFDSADEPAKASALDTLGFEFAPDGSVRPKEAKP